MSQYPAAIPSDVRERIIAAAADLYEQTGRETMPTVDAVRRAARVDMNAASSIMKEWRRAQTAQAAPVAVSVPEVVQQATGAAVVAIWQQAQDLANESLRSAQGAWETERGELDSMRQELAEAFERQASELEAVGQALAGEQTKTVETARVLADVRQKLADASSRADMAEARIAEIEHRAADLRTELDRTQGKAETAEQTHVEQRKQAAAEVEAARAATESLRVELAKHQSKTDAQTEAHVEQRKQAAAEAHRVAEHVAKVQGERDNAAKAAAEARERAAGLAGQVQSLQDQNASLLATLKSSIKDKPTKTSRAK